MKESQFPSEMLILAGGFGTRLQSVVSNVPKPMAPVGERPFLSYLMDHWIGQGIRRFRLSTGHLAGVIESFFGDSYEGASIVYVRENSPLGTGGALRLALDAADWSSDAILVANGDTWFPVSLRQLCVDALIQETPVTLSVKEMQKNDRYGGVSIGDDGKVTSFAGTSGGSCLINGGCYLINAKEIHGELSGMPASFSFEADFLPSYAARGCVGSSIQNEPFLDIGIPEDYRRAASFLMNA